MSPSFQLGRQFQFFFPREIILIGVSHTSL